MSLITDLVMWFGIGIAASLVGPILLAIVIPRVLSARYADFAWGMVMSSIGQGLIIFRETTRKPELHGYSQHSVLPTLMVKLSGERKHYVDMSDLVGTFKGRPLGLALEDVPVITDPRISEIGALMHKNHQSDSGVIETDGGYAIRGYVPLREGNRGVDIGGVKRAVSGDATAALVELIKQWTETGQSGFDSHSDAFDYFIWLTAWGIGFGAMWMATKTDAAGVTGGGGAPVNPIPAVLGVIPL